MSGGRQRLWEARGRRWLGLPSLGWCLGTRAHRLPSLCSWRVFVPGLPNYVHIPSYRPPVRRNPNRPE